MRIALRLLLLMSLAGILPASTVSAQSSDGSYLTTLNEIDESYMQMVADPDYLDSIEDGRVSVPVLISVLFVTDSEEQAQDLFGDISSLGDSDVSAPTESLDDVGDEAVLIFPSEDDDVTQVVVARDGDVFLMISAAAWPEDSSTPVDVARHILENGSSDEPYEVSEGGEVSGGWSTAFPTSGDFEELDELEFAPITQWPGIPVAQPVSRPQRATPAAAIVESQPQMQPMSMLTQNYIDMSDEGMESDSLPQIVLITVQEFDSPESAEIAFASMSEGGPDQTGMTIEPIENLGDEAVFVNQEDQAGDHGATTIARDENVIVMAFVTGAPAELDISKDIVTHIIEAGPSDEPLSFDDEGVATGGWVDAFPQPDEIPGLEHFSPQPVTNFNDE